MKAAFQVGLHQKAHPARIQQSQLLQLDAEALQTEVQQWLSANVMLDAEPEMDVEDDDDTVDMDAVWSPAEAAAELPWDHTLSVLARGGSFDHHAMDVAPSVLGRPTAGGVEIGLRDVGKASPREVTPEMLLEEPPDQGHPFLLAPPFVKSAPAHT